MRMSNTTNDTYIQQVSYKEANQKTKHIKPIIFMDVDDVIIDTHQTIIDILNSRFDLGFTIEDVKEWGFDRILERLNTAIKSDSQLERQITEEGYHKPLTVEYIIHIFDSEEFWDRVWFQTNAMSVLNHLSRRYDIIFISQGTNSNLVQKEQWLSLFVLCDFEFLKVGYFESKSTVIMKKVNEIIMESLKRGVKIEVINSLFTVQVDDKYSNLESICDLKILLKNNRATYFNQVEDNTREDLYIMNDLKDVEAVLKFYNQYNHETLNELFPQKKSFIQKIFNSFRRDNKQIQLI